MSAFGGVDPPAELFHYSRYRRAEHPRAHLGTWSAILQADAYGGYGERHAPPVLEAGRMRAANCSSSSGAKLCHNRLKRIMRVPGQSLR